MTTVRMVQVPADQIVDVIAVRDRLMAAARPVNMVGGVTATRMVGRAVRWIGLALGDGVFFHPAVRALVVQMAIMKKIDMSGVFDGGVAAIGPVDMVVIRVVLRHGSSIGKLLSLT